MIVFACKFLSFTKTIFVKTTNTEIFRENPAQSGSFLLFLARLQTIVQKNNITFVKILQI